MTAVDADSSREHWDAQAATYDKDKARNATYYRALKSLIEQAIPTSHRGRVLDVGCGTGQVLAALSPRQGMVQDGPCLQA